MEYTPDYYSGVAGFGNLFGLQFIIVNEYAAEVESVLLAGGYLPPESKVWDFKMFRQVATGVKSISQEEQADLEEIANASGMLFCAPEDDIAAKINEISSSYLKDIAECCRIL